MYTSDRNIKESNAINDSSDKLMSLRVTKNRDYFISDRLGISGFNRGDKSGQSHSTLPYLDKSSNLKQLSFTRSKLSLNKTFNDDLPSVREFSHGHSTSRLTRPLIVGSSKNLYLKAENLLDRKIGIESFIDPIVVAQIKKNKNIIDNLMDKERKKTIEARTSQEFSNISFFRPIEVARPKPKLNRSSSPSSLQEVS